jgi:hypothetical protein
VKEGPPGAPYYAGAASRECCGGCADCCCRGRIPGHIEIVEGGPHRGAPAVVAAAIAGATRAIVLAFPFPLPFSLLLPPLLGLGTRGGGAV